MTTINTIFEGIEEHPLDLSFTANDLASDTVTIIVDGSRCVMELRDFMLAVEFMKKAANAVRRIT